MIRSGAVLRLVVLGAVIGVAILVAVLVGIPTATQLRTHFTGMGAWAPLLFAGFYALATLSPLPKSVFTLAAGAVFGLAEGLLVVLAGALVGAVLAFYVARALGRDGVQRLIGVRADRFDEQFASHGFLAVLLARLIPIVPFTVVNYLAGLTAIRVRVFVAATAIGMLPATTAYVALGAYGSRPRSWPFWVAVGALVALTAIGGVSQWWRRRRSRTQATGQGNANELTVSATPSADGSTSTQS
jgi:uncharacterized membrane protein YdjX (TVP38/TMEM64 family)